ncbi:spore gernimation protein KB [Paenibacillus sp. IHB B 3084]|uniref:spore germination protein n=1 Tax=Paenibacillus sp. IHB B 3084 TaxID=867076 RepID=UPI000720D334|nr:spore germination protein [Paenibacillus sp. IHB B 3084]ALP37107.1 spore gernimation protein KB [Paenibacillus sp. IHB B 3084]
MIRYPYRKHNKKSDADKNNKNSSRYLKIEAHLETNLQQFKELTSNSPDFLIRRFSLRLKADVPAAIVFLSSMVKTDMVNELVMKSLLSHPSAEVAAEAKSAEELFSRIQSHALELGEVKECDDWNSMMEQILTGYTIILLEGCEKAIACGTRGGEARAVAEPTTHTVVSGPKEGFVESLFTNISLIRRRIKSSDLAIEMFKVGNTSLTNVAMLYMKTIADQSVIDEVRRRVKSINIDAIFESGMVEEMIQDHYLTPLPTIYNSERPDTISSNIMEGRVALIVDGTPFVLVMPTVFAQFFQSSADYSERFSMVIVVRLIRYISFIILILGPSLYIALTTYHYEMIPTPLLISIMAQREFVPFPAFIEAFILEVTFEILREAGIRMPRVGGQTVSVIGALVLGQAAVEAGLVTPLLTIVVALTGIASYAIPAYNMATAGRLFRFAFMLLAAFMGLFGITLGLIALIAHMNSLRSFGVPYMAPFSPFILENQKDAVLRLPFWMMQERPKSITSTNQKQMKDGSASSPSNETTPQEGGAQGASGEGE